MNYNEAIDNNKVDFGNMPPQPFLLGLLSAFDNRYQAIADSYFGEITWKHFLRSYALTFAKNRLQELYLKKCQDLNMKVQQIIENIA